jgi:hypothetical protein
MLSTSPCIAFQLLVTFPQNRLLPRFINKQHLCWGSSKHTPKRKKRNEMETKVNQLNEGDTQTLRPPEKCHHALQIVKHQTTPSGRKASMLLLGPETSPRGFLGI